MTTFLTKILEKYKLQENLEWQVDENKESLISQLKNLTNEDYYSGIFANYVFNCIVVIIHLSKTC